MKIKSKIAQKSLNHSITQSLNKSVNQSAHTNKLIPETPYNPRENYIPPQINLFISTNQAIQGGDPDIILESQGTYNS